MAQICAMTGVERRSGNYESDTELDGNAAVRRSAGMRTVRNVDDQHG